MDYHIYNNAGSGISPNSDGVDNSLPVTLNSFSSIIFKESIALQWTTQSEIDVLGYEIQRAMEAKGPFQTIASYKDHPELKAVGSSSAETTYQFTDNTVQSGVTYWYKLISHDLDGSRQSFGPISATQNGSGKDIQNVNGQKPLHYALKQNFPNPFNNSTQIEFNIPENKQDAVAVQLRIYDLSGRLVRTLIDQPLRSGSYRVRWDGTNESGQLMPSGIYIYQLKSPQFVHSKKMILIQ